MSKLVLYSTEGCHLCEMAFAQTQQLGLEVEIIDIAFDDVLYERYGVTIPVLRAAGAEGSGVSELNWPFEIEELQNWLDTNGITYHK